MRHNPFFFIPILLCTFPFLYANAQQPVPGNTFGYTKGSLTVTDAGAAIYNIHLEIAPGLGGLQPDLNIIYSSSGGNGPLGLGWSLQGLSAISRVPRNWAQDGSYGTVPYFITQTIESKVNFNHTDRYALDGERLALAYDNTPTNSWVDSAYGYPGTKYFTERNDFSKIVLSDTVDGSPSFFKVYNKDGLIREYGNTADSRILLSSNNRPIYWLVNSIEDRNGNFIHFKYYSNSTTNEYYPTKIEFSGNGKLNKAAQDSIVFVYDTRQDTLLSYYKGAKIVLSQRLKAIVCYAKDKVIRRYDLSYAYSANSNNSLLTLLQESGTNGAQLKPTTFQYMDDILTSYYKNNNSQDNINKALVLNSPADKLIETGDFNGDGLSDIMTYKPSTGETVFLINAYPSQSYREIDNPIDKSTITNGVLLLADLNADGKTDVFFYDTITGRNNFYLIDFQNNTIYPRRQQVADSSEIAANVKGGCRIMFQDFTNDGLIDLFIYKNKGDFVNLGWNTMFINTGNYNAYKTLTDPSINVGKLDFSVTGYFIGLTAGFNYPNLPVSIRDSSALYVADLDNNAYPDYLLYNKKTGQTAVYYAYTTSSNFLNYEKQVYTENTDAPLLNLVDPAEIAGNDSSDLQLVDLNSDGLPDLVYYDKQNVVLKCWLNKGDFTFERSAFKGFDLAGIKQYYQVSDISFVDENVDGKVDLCIYDKNTGTNVYLVNNGNLYFLNNRAAMPTDFFDSKKFVLPGKFNATSANDYLVIDPATGSNQQYSTSLNTIHGYDKIVNIIEPTKALDIEYSTLLDSTIYKRTIPYTVYPNTEFTNVFTVATRISILDPILGIPLQGKTHEYKYQDAVLNLQGRGFRGFRKTQELDYSNGVKTTKYYFRDTSNNIYVGDPITRVETDIVGGITPLGVDIHAATSDYDLGYNFYPKNQFGVSFYSFTKQNVSTNYEANGNVASSTRTRQQVDYYGNVTTMVIDYGDGSIDSTLNTFYNDTANWILGRLTDATLYRIVPGKPMLVRESAFDYDAVTGQLVKEISFANLDDKLKLTKVYKYDDYGNIIESDVTGWNGKAYETRSTTSEYDTSGRFITKAVNPLGHTVVNEYDIYTGKLILAKDANGLATSYSYDDFGRLQKEVYADGNWDYYDYKFYDINITDRFTKPYSWAIIKQSSLEGNMLEFYDELDRKIGTQKVGFSGKEVLEEKEFYTNDLVGTQSRWHYYDEPAKTARNGYDAFNRHNYQQRPGNIVDSVSFDVNTKTWYNSLGQKKSIVYNAKEQPVQIIDNNGQQLLYDYDAAGNILSITDPKGNKIINQYDLKGNKIKMTDPDLGTYTYMYNAFNELVQQTYSTGNNIQFEYDKLSRLVKRTEKEGVTNWVYDLGNMALGKLSSVTNYDTSGEKYIYDSLGRLANTVVTVNGKDFNIHVSYNAQGRLDTLKYPSGFAVKNVYNTYGYLKEVRRVGDNFLYWRADKVNALGMLEVQEQANSVFAQYFYNPETMLLDSLNGSNSNNFFNQWKFEFNSVGSLTSRTNVGVGKTEYFSYDNLNRLIQSHIANSDAVNVKYDEIGNIIEKSDVGTYDYGSVNNGPHRVVKINQLTSQCIPSSLVTAEYTSFNKVSKLTNDTASLEIHYGFDKQRTFAKYYINSRLSKTKIYIKGLFELEIAGDTVTETNYVTAGNSIIATYVVSNGTGHSYYWFKDHLGSLTTLTDSLGNTVEEFSYDAWGKRRNADWSSLSAGISITSRGFTGHEHYDLFDLVDMNGRIYDPVIGRFTSADPFINDMTDLQSFNRYSYVRNSPLSYTDPSGYFLDFIGDAFSWVGNAVGSAVGAVANVLSQGAMWVKDNWKTLVVVTAAIATTVVTGGTAGAFWATVLSGAAGGFVGGLTGTLLNGGSISDALGAGFKGALIGGLSAGLTYGVGDIAAKLGTSGGNVTAEGLGVKIAGHGLVQGGIEKLNGGQFLHGLYSGSLSGGFGGATDGLDSKAIRLLGAAALGGATSEISGGKFANGAITGAYVMMFNDFAHNKMKEQAEKATEILEYHNKAGEVLGEGAKNQWFGEYSEGIETGAKAFGITMGVGSFVINVSAKEYYQALWNAIDVGATVVELNPYVAAVIHVFKAESTAPPELDEARPHGKQIP